MKHAGTSLLLLLASSVFAAAEPPAWETLLRAQQVIWDSPSADSWGSMPTGNGDLGANVWVEPSGELVLRLSKSDAWSGNGRLLKLGRVRIQLPSVENFRQELNLIDGEITIRGGDATTRVWIDANHPVIRVEMAAKEPFATSVKYETWRPAPRELRGDELHSAYGLLDSAKRGNQPHRPGIVAPDTVVDGQSDRIVFYHRNTHSIWQENMRLQALGDLALPEHDPLMRRTFGAMVCGAGLVNDANNRLVASQPQRSFSIAIHPLTENRYIRFYWQGGIEMVMLMLEYHERTGDAAFLKQTLLPFATQITTLFDQHWPRGADGKIHFHPAMALETYRTATNPLPEIAGLGHILPRLIALTDDPARQAAWRRMLGDLPPMPVTGNGGKRWLLPAAEFSGKQNQENPELYAIFPYRRYGVGKPEIEVAMETWRRKTHKGTGCWYQNAIMAALLGLTDEARKMVIENFQTHCPGFRFPALWGPGFDWVPDQDHGGVAMTALQFMLLQAEGDKILLLPAWPDDWDATFKLHAPRQTTVEGEVRGGKLHNLKVTPESRRKDIVIPRPSGTE